MEQTGLSPKTFPGQYGERSGENSMFSMRLFANATVGSRQLLVDSPSGDKRVSTSVCCDAAFAGDLEVGSVYRALTHEICYGATDCFVSRKVFCRSLYS